MATDLFGSTALPLPTPATGEQPGDVAIGIVAGFCQAVLNADAQTAWSTVADGYQACKTAYTHDPSQYVFAEKDLPAIYVTRTEGKLDILGDEWECLRDVIKAWWVFPPAPQERQRVRGNITSGLVKSLWAAASRGRHPAYVRIGDTDPTAATLAALPDAVRLAHATPTVDTTYSGAALDGTIGAGALSTPRPLTLTLGGDPAAWSAGTTLTVTYLDRMGLARSEVFTAGSVPHTFTTAFDAKSAVSVVVQAQASAAGILSVGAGAYAGVGTSVQVAAGFALWHLAEWKDSTIAIRLVDGDVRTYDAVEITFEVVDRLELDPTNAARFDSQVSSVHGAFITYQRGEDGSTIQSSDLPDAGIT